MCHVSAVTIFWSSFTYVTSNRDIGLSRLKSLRLLYLILISRESWHLLNRVHLRPQYYFLSKWLMYTCTIPMDIFIILLHLLSSSDPVYFSVAWLIRWRTGLGSESFLNNSADWYKSTLQTGFIKQTALPIADQITLFYLQQCWLPFASGSCYGPPIKIVTAEFGGRIFPRSGPAGAHLDCSKFVNFGDSPSHSIHNYICGITFRRNNGMRRTLKSCSRIIHASCLLSPTFRMHNPHAAMSHYPYRHSTYYTRAEDEFISELPVSKASA